ncbi:MAG: stalk domain-containing protein [Methanobacterium sp.]
MKQFFTIILIFLVTLIPASHAFTKDDFSVYMNGEIIVFDKEKPCMMQGELFIPLRDVIERTVAAITWDSLNNAAIIKLRNIIITIPAESNTATVKTPLKTYLLQSNYKTYIKNNTLLIPLDLMAGIFQINTSSFISNHIIYISTHIPSVISLNGRSFYLDKEIKPFNFKIRKIVDFTCDGMEIIDDKSGTEIYLVDEKGRIFLYHTFDTTCNYSATQNQ